MAERHGQVRPSVDTLELVLLEDHAVERPAPLVDGVEPLTEADDMLLGTQAECEADAPDTVRVTEPCH